MPINYKYKGACLSACPDNDDTAIMHKLDFVYEANYTEFTCDLSDNAYETGQTDRVRI